MIRKSLIFSLVGLLILLTAVPALAVFTMQWTGVLHGVDNPWDDYEIYMEAGATIEVSHQCLPTPELDPAIVILDINGTVLGDDDDSGSPDCDQGNSAWLQFTAPASGWYIVQANSYEIFYDDDPTDLDANGPYLLTVTGDFSLPDTAKSGDEINDGRVNSRDPAAPLAVYCPAGLPVIYAIDGTGHGTLAFAVTQEQIDAVGVPEVNTLIAEGTGIRLYRLPGGQFQVVSAPDAEGKVYQMRYAVCAAGAALVSFTE